MRELKQVQWLRVAADKVALKEVKEFAISGQQKDSVREETKCSFRHGEVKRAKPTPKNRSTL